MFLSPKASRVDSDRKIIQEFISASLTNLNVDTVSQYATEVARLQIFLARFFLLKYVGIVPNNQP